MTLLAILPVLGIAVALMRLVPGRSELALLCSVGLITGLVYVLGLVGLLAPGAIIVFWGGTALLAASPWWLRRGGIDPGRLASPGIVLFVAFAIMQWVLFRRAEYFFWDEFSHWGLVARELTHTDHLFGAGGNVQFPHYPPGTGVFHYTIARNLGYTEANVLFAQFLLLLAPSMILYRGTSWKRPQWIVAAAAVQILLFANLGHGTANLYVDHILSVFFGAVVIAGLSHGPTPRTLVLLAPPLFCLVLIKEVGSFLAVVAALWIAVEYVAAGSLRPAGRRRWVSVAALVLVVAVPVLARTSWNWHLSRHGVAAPSAQHADSGEVMAAWFGSPDGYRATVKERFSDVLLTQQVSRSAVSQEFNEFSYPIRDRYPAGFRLSAVGFLLLALALMVARALLAARHRAMLWRLAGTTGAMFAVYAVMLFALYTFMFSEDKAVNLASYVRYVNIVLFPIVMIAFAVWLPAGKRFAWRSGREAVGRWVAAGVLLGLYLVETPYLEPMAGNRPRVRVRATVAARIEPVKALVPDDASLFVISLVRDNGFMETLLRYELMPARVAFGEPTSSTDLQRRLGAHDYLFVFALNPDDVKRLGGVFAGGGTLFKVDRSGGQMRLLPPR